MRRSASWTKTTMETQREGEMMGEVEVAVEAVVVSASQSATTMMFEVGKESTEEQAGSKKVLPSPGSVKGKERRKSHLGTRYKRTLLPDDAETEIWGDPSFGGALRKETLLEIVQLEMNKLNLRIKSGDPLKKKELAPLQQNLSDLRMMGEALDHSVIVAAEEVLKKMANVLVAQEMFKRALNSGGPAEILAAKEKAKELGVENNLARAVTAMAEIGIVVDRRSPPEVTRKLKSGERDSSPPPQIIKPSGNENIFPSPISRRPASSSMGLFNTEEVRNERYRLGLIILSLSLRGMEKQPPVSKHQMIKDAFSKWRSHARPISEKISKEESKEDPLLEKTGSFQEIKVFACDVAILLLVNFFWKSAANFSKEARLCDSFISPLTLIGASLILGNCVVFWIQNDSFTFFRNAWVIALIPVLLGVDSAICTIGSSASSI